MSRQSMNQTELQQKIMTEMVTIEKGQQLANLWGNKNANKAVPYIFQGFTKNGLKIKLGIISLSGPAGHKSEKSTYAKFAEIDGEIVFNFAR